MQSTKLNITNMLDNIRMSNNNFEDSIAALKSYLGKDVKVRFETPAECNDLVVPRRILLTAERRTTTILSKACGGLILEFPSWKVLARPSPVISIASRTRDLSKRLHQYKIYQIRDGTVVTLYFYNNRWQMASMNGFDVSTLCWIGPITYANALAEIMKTSGWSFDNLDTSLQYTIGFRHHNFHPLLTDPESAWLIQISCGENILENGENPLTIIQGLPWQTPITIPQFTNPFGKKTDNLVWMQSQNETALSNYISSRCRGTEIHYGYLLRHPTDDDFLLESSLLTFIRRSVYDLPKYDRSIASDNRMDYVILKAYLSYTHRYDFRAVFPQFDSRAKSLDNLFDKLHRCVMFRLRCTDVIPKAPGSFGERLDTVAAMLTKEIQTFTAINVMNPDGSDIVKDFIIDPKYLDNYHPLMASFE